MCVRVARIGFVLLAIAEPVDKLKREDTVVEVCLLFSGGYICIWAAQ